MKPEENGHFNDGEPTLRQLVRGLHDKMDDHSKKQDRIYTVIFGDKEAKQEGLVDKVDRHQKWISMDKKIKIFGTGLAASGGTGWAFWDSIKQLFLK